LTNLRFGIRDLLWAIALLAMGLAWYVDRSKLRESVRYLDWKAYHLSSYAPEAEKVTVDDEYGVLDFEYPNGSRMGASYPTTAERRKAWDEFRSLAEP